MKTVVINASTEARLLVGGGRERKEKLQFYTSSQSFAPPAPKRVART